MKWFDLIGDDCCIFCPQSEIVEYLFFECPRVIVIWKQVLVWMDIQHTHVGWTEELRWLGHKGWKTCFLCSVVVETVYKMWRYRNNKSFGNTEYYEY